MPSPIFMENTICSCSETKTCPSCLFCEAYNTTDGRKALCEKIVSFLVWKPFYQRALRQAMERLFPSKVVYDDEKDICTILFDAMLFEDTSTGITPLAYFVDHAAPGRRREAALFSMLTEFDSRFLEPIIVKLECAAVLGNVADELIGGVRR